MRTQDAGPQDTRRGVALADVLVALGLNGCAPRRGRYGWRSECPACRAADSVGIKTGLGGLAIVPRCGCTRAAVLAALGLEEER